MLADGASNDCAAAHDDDDDLAPSFSDGVCVYIYTHSISLIRRVGLYMYTWLLLGCVLLKWGIFAVEQGFIESGYNRVSKCAMGSTLIKLLDLTFIIK